MLFLTTKQLPTADAFGFNKERQAEIREEPSSVCTNINNGCLASKLFLVAAGKANQESRSSVRLKLSWAAVRRQLAKHTTLRISWTLSGALLPGPRASINKRIPSGCSPKSKL